MRGILTFGLLLFSLSLLAQADYPGITVSAAHPQYWQYKGETILLLGGSDEDNLFQMPGVEGHLDTLKSAGGNYVRCTMSSRDAGNVWAFYWDEEKELYDLNRWNEAYWTRFENFLNWTDERDIIVQVEIWATFDFYRENWDVNPFNPKNNSNYTAERTDLPESVPTHPVYTDNSFFWSIPSQENNMPVLAFQQKFVDKLLSYTFQHGNVLYCMDNETSVTSDWGKFWATYIQKRAQEEGKVVHCTEMWDPWDLNHISHRESFDHPELYSFVEISQNNHKTGQKHWDNGLAQIERLRKLDNLRPVTNIKIYGADGGRHGGDDQDAMEKFCRAILFGASSARFHRPTSGIGLNEKAQTIISTMRMLTDAVDFFNMKPMDRLLDRSENEAYCRGKKDEYLLYFPNGGDVRLAVEGDWRMQWFDLATGDGQREMLVSANEKGVPLQCPGEGQWAVVVRQ